MNICLFEQEEISKPLKADDPRAVHIKKILHKGVGDTFAAGIIGGQAGTATITKIDGAIHFTFTPQSDGKPLFPLHMVIGFPRPIQLKRLLRDMAALGVASVRLCGTELGEKSYLKASLSDPAEVYKIIPASPPALTRLPRKPERTQAQKAPRVLALQTIPSKPKTSGGPCSLPWTTSTRKQTSSPT